MRGTRTNQAGFTMIELMIAVGILSVAMMGAFSALASINKQNQYLREEAAARRAAVMKIAEIRDMAATSFGRVTDPHDNLVDPGYGVDSSGDCYTWHPILIQGHNVQMGLMSGGVAQNEGEVLLITDGTPDESAYGRDLDDDGFPDGVDLNGDGDTVDVLDGSSSGSLFSLDLDVDDDGQDDLVPVVVIVRWRSLAGEHLEGRVELMTVIGRLDI